MFRNKNTFAVVISACLFLVTCGSSSDNDTPIIEKDTVKPTITCLEDIDIIIELNETSTDVTYTTPVGTDNLAGASTVQTAGLKSGSSFPLGKTINTFEVTDAAGNKSSCSFNITVSHPEANTPYSLENGVPTPDGQKWTRVESLSDDFDGTSFDDNKWHRNPATDGFNWIGREPALFESDNVSVSDGNLNVTVEKFDSPKTVNGKEWTHGGAIIRSKEKAKQGHYYECRMKANKTIMSSTFWIAFQQNCNTGPIRKLELDIQECVGRVHSGTDSWASKWDNIFHSNAIRHKRTCDINEETRKSGVKNLTEKNHDRFFVYGCWWKSPTEILFYLDGEYVYSITPTTEFDLEGHITMAIETYSWNPVDEAGSIFETGSFDDLTTKYDWVRTWVLENE
ncbi:HYR domain-containing protein [Lutibacter oricola]|uniref:HYR domain-containing protein n=1 Tax=Lutibacter oricola TaxID=762486 RepID=A0A1H3G7W7_9FLAO|nr:HYR domain-containing protein [Lutibacter oricola]SDX99137.1 HYR domain-containing protein [Lutibacter oricola]